MIELVIRRGSGIRWWVGWPFEFDGGYRPATPEHEQLLAWWQADGRLTQVTGFATYAALLDAVDLAVRAQPPPWPFKLTRNGTTVRTYSI